MNKIINFKINEQVKDDNIISQIEELSRSGTLLEIKNIEDLLKHLAYLVRKKIADYEGKEMYNFSYSNKCDLAQSMIYYYLRGLNIKVNSVNINEIISNVCGHSFVIATFKTRLGQKSFLIDPTYLQFFCKENCDVRKYVIIKNIVCISPDPGYFVAKSNKKDVLLPLLENGYIELTEEVAKVYGDSFFQTKLGVQANLIKYNVTSGSNYIRWFKNISSCLSKTEEELSNMNLLVESVSRKKFR